MLVCTHAHYLSQLACGSQREHCVLAVSFLFGILGLVQQALLTSEPLASSPCCCLLVCLFSYAILTQQ